MARLWRLRELGAYIAIDDAGSGYSGLTRLLEVRPSFVKLDRGLVLALRLSLARRLVSVAGSACGGGMDQRVVGPQLRDLMDRPMTPSTMGTLLGVVHETLRWQRSRVTR